MFKITKEYFLPVGIECCGDDYVGRKPCPYYDLNRDGGIGAPSICTLFGKWIGYNSRLQECKDNEKNLVTK